MLCYPTVLLTMQQIFGWKNGSCHFALKPLLPYCPTDQQRLKCKIARAILTHLGQMPIVRTKLNGAGEWRRVVGRVVLVMAALAAAQAVTVHKLVDLT